MAMSSSPEPPDYGTNENIEGMRTVYVNKKDRLRTQIVSNLAAVSDYADRTFLPAFYNVLEDEIGTGPAALGVVTSARSVLGAVGIPLWGWLADRYSRKKLLAVGCVFWGISMIFVGLSWDFWSLLVFRSINGAGLGMVLPAIMSLITDYFRMSERGKAFGYVTFCGVIGAGGGAAYAAAVSSVQVMGMSGWRFACFSFAVFSCILAILVMLVAKDPIRGGADLEDEQESRQTALLSDAHPPLEQDEIEEAEVAEVEMKEEQRKEPGWFRKMKTLGKRALSIVPRRKKLHLVEKIHKPKPWVEEWRCWKQILQRPTAIVLMTTTVLYGFPFSGFNFIILYLEYAGFQPVVASAVFAVLGIGSACGMLFGGKLGDYFSKKYKYKGRAVVAIISSYAGLPLIIVMIVVIPPHPDYTVWYCIVAFFAAFLSSWPYASAIGPLISEVTMPLVRSRAYSIISVVDGSVGSLGSFVLGVMAESWFGYQDHPNERIPDLPTAIRDVNRDALGYSLLYMTAFCWCLAGLVYCILFFVYPRDRKWAEQELLRFQREQNISAAEREFLDRKVTVQAKI